MKYLFKKQFTLLCSLTLFIALIFPLTHVSANHVPNVSNHSILVNQSGYNLGLSKRFTAPMVPDNTNFTIINIDNSEEVYTGTIINQVGDFSDFNPDGLGEYVIEVNGEQSVPFSIGPYWIEGVSYQPALDFMIDSRSWLGDVTGSTFSGIAWRDSHQFSFEVPTLVQQFLANPSAYENMPRQMKYGGRFLEPQIIENGFIEGSARDIADPSKIWRNLPDQLVGQTYLLADQRDKSAFPPFEDYVMYNVKSSEPVKVYAIVDSQKIPSWISKDNWEDTSLTVETENDGVGKVYTKSFDAGIIDLKRGISDIGTAFVFEGAAVKLVQTPDIVELIRFGTEIIYVRNANHTLLKEQLAYFLYAYPYLKEWISQDMYNKIRDYTFNIWRDTDRSRFNWYDISHTANLLQTYTVMGTGKGSFPPGHSIVPNLMMYEVAKREGRSDFQDYFDAAYRQTDWIIKNLDWFDPTTTKGQRMSEHVTMEGLAYFQQEYPELAPSGLLNKIRQWAVVMSSRSDNLWDFRKYSEDTWIIPEYNEPGNVIGFPASAFAASQVIPEEGLKKRLERIAISQIDHMFGRNPYNRHFSHDASRDFRGVEYGWFIEHQGGYGALNNVRGVIDGSAKEAAYPYNPNSYYGYVEGWVAFNAAWNASLAYLSNYETKIRILDNRFANELNTLSQNQEIGIELIAPLNFDYQSIESGYLTVVTSTGDSEKIRMVERTENGISFTTTAKIEDVEAIHDDGVIQVSADGWISISYGFGLFKKEVRYVGNGTHFIKEDIVPPTTPSPTIEFSVSPGNMTAYVGSKESQFDIQLLNYLDHEEEVNVAFSTPTGINIIENNSTLTIPAFDVIRPTFTVEITENASVGTYQIPITITYGDNESLNNHVEIKVEKKSVPKIFEDNFEDKQADGWTSVLGAWKVETVDLNSYYKNSLNSGSSALTIAGDPEWTDFRLEAKMNYEKGSARGYAGGVVFRYLDNNNFYHFRLHESNGAELYKWVNGKASRIAAASFNWQTDAWYTLKVEVIGDRIIANVDDQIVLEANDSSLQKGLAGFRNYGGIVAFDEIGVYPILLEDSFENGQQQIWTPVTGSWSIEALEGNGVYQANTKNGSSSAISVAGDSTWSDYTITAKMNFQQSYSSSGYSSGVIFRFVDSKNFYHFRLDSIKGAELFKWVNGTASKIAEKSFSWTKGNWFDLKVEVKGSQIKGYVNDQLLIDIVDTSLTKGSIGLRNYNGITVFDNIGVYPINENIDQTPPEIHISAVVDGGTYTNSVIPVVNVEDTGSGIKEIAMLLNDQEWINGTPVTDKGEYTLVITAVDKAENVTTKTVQFTLYHDTELYVESALASYSDVIPLRVKLNGNNGDRIAGEVVTFVINGKNIGTATTDEQGNAILDYKVELEASEDGDANYQITAFVEQNDTTFYRPSESTGTLTVSKEVAQITYTGTTLAKQENMITLAAQVVQEEDGEMGEIMDLPIKFTISQINSDGTSSVIDEVYGGELHEQTFLTDEDGRVQTEIQLPAGLYEISVELIKNNYYTTSNNTSTVAVYDENAGSFNAAGWIEVLEGMEFIGSKAEKIHLEAQWAYDMDLPKGSLRLHAEPQGLNFEMLNADWMVISRDRIYLYGTAIDENNRLYTILLMLEDDNDSNSKPELSLKVWKKNEDIKSVVLELYAKQLQGNVTIK